MSASPEVVSLSWLKTEADALDMALTTLLAHDSLRPYLSSLTPFKRYLEVIKKAKSVRTDQVQQVQAEPHFETSLSPTGARSERIVLGRDERSRSPIKERSQQTSPNGPPRSPPEEKPASWTAPIRESTTRSMPKNIAFNRTSQFNPARRRSRSLDDPEPPPVVSLLAPGLNRGSIRRSAAFRDGSQPQLGEPQISQHSSPATTAQHAASPLSSPLLRAPPSQLTPPAASSSAAIPTSHSSGKSPINKAVGRFEVTRRHALSDGRSNPKLPQIQESQGQQQPQQQLPQQQLPQHILNPQQPSRPADMITRSGPARPRPLVLTKEVEVSVEIESPRTRSNRSGLITESLIYHIIRTYKLLLGLENRFFQCRSPCSLVSQLAVKMAETKLRDVAFKIRPRNIIRFLVLTPRALYFYKTASDPEPTSIASLYHLDLSQGLLTFPDNDDPNLLISIEVDPEKNDEWMGAISAQMSYLRNPLSLYGLENPQRLAQCLQENNLRLSLAVIKEASEEMERAIPLVLEILSKIGNPLFQFLLNSIESEFTTTTMDTLFRGNTAPSRILKYFINQTGDHFLKEVMSKVLGKIIAENKPMEIFPTKISAEECVEDNIRNVVGYVDCVMDSIIAHLHLIPPEIHFVMWNIGHTFISRFGNNDQYKAICCSLFFLRFICPVIAIPQKFLGNIPIQPNVQRGLVYITKIIQNISNNLCFGKKESEMMVFNDCIYKHQQKLDVILKKFEEKIAIPDRAPRGVPLQTVEELQAIMTNRLPNLTPYLYQYRKQDLPY